MANVGVMLPVLGSNAPGSPTSSPDDKDAKTGRLCGQATSTSVPVPYLTCPSREGGQ